MSGLFNLGGPLRRPDESGNTQIVQSQRVLDRIFAFTGRTIHDVVNDPIARNQVIGYYKLLRWVDREMEIGALERQWNSI
jgi:hypothetical protein